MAVTYNFLVHYEYINFSRWSATLEFVITNRGLAVEGPIKFAFDFPEEVVPTTNTDFEVDQSGFATTHVSGTLAQGLARGEAVIFNVNLGSPDGTLGSEDLPTVSYINDLTVISDRPADPTNLRVQAIRSDYAELFWDESIEGDYPIEEYLVTYGLPGNFTTITTRNPYVALRLEPGRPYIAYVQAIDVEGGISPGLNEVIFQSRVE